MTSSKYQDLGELCSLITDGKHGDCKNEDNSGYYFVSCKDVKDGQINYDNARQIVHGDFAETHRRTDLNPGDVLLTNSGTIGRLAIAPDDEKTPRTTFQKSVAVLKPITSKITSHFLYYSLASEHARLINTAGGAAQKNLLLGDLRRFPIMVPSLAEQNSITSILSTYDDLIENNQQRIELLEQAARLLYREWFVHLRFPGHEHVRIVDGVPEGWEKKSAFDMMDVLSGGTPKTKVQDYWGGNIPFYTPKDAVEYAYVSSTEKTLTEDGLRNCNSKLYPKDTVFITARGTVGKINLAKTDMAMNQSCYALAARSPINQYFLYFAIVDGVEQFRSRAVGAVFDAIIRDTFKMIPFVVPDIKIIQAFTDHVTPMLRQIDILSTETEKLIYARDLLLPRLMNGGVIV